MSIVVEVRASRTVRCECGALLRYNHEDVRTGPAFGVAQGWPWIPCPEPGCERSCLVAGVL